MKLFIHILITLIALLVVGCQNESEETRLIDRAEWLYDTFPDSVITVLDSIPLPEEMNPSLVARWCMLYARAADKIGDEMPYINQLEIALRYYQKKEMREEEAEIGLYLGSSYAEDKEYEKAMLAYSDALEVAFAIKDYNRAGYILSYKGDLYELDNRYIVAAAKYKEARGYFQLANNTKSYLRAFVNEARSYSIADSNYLALNTLKQAELILDSLHVEEVRGYVYNALGNIYIALEKYDLAEKYIFDAIRSGSNEVASDYLQLVHIEQKRGNLDRAEYYLQIARNIAYDNEFVPVTIAYHTYQIEKRRGDYKSALSFYEQYVAVEDSFVNISKTIDIYDTEQKYEHLKLHNENVKLLLKNQRSYTFVLILLFACALFTIIYLITIRRKNYSIWIKQQKINDLSLNIGSLYTELQGKEAELDKLQNIIRKTELLDDRQGSLDEIFVVYEKVKGEVENLRSRLIHLKEVRILHSSLAKKLKNLSQTVQPNISQSLITEKIWIDIDALMREICPDLLKMLDDANLTSSEKHLCLLTLFKLDTKAIAILLNIIPTSVDKTRLRVRKKLQWGGKQDLYESFVHMNDFIDAVY